MDCMATTQTIYTIQWLTRAFHVNSCTGQAKSGYWSKEVVTVSVIPAALPHTGWLAMRSECSNGVCRDLVFNYFPMEKLTWILTLKDRIKLVANYFKLYCARYNWTNTVCRSLLYKIKIPLCFVRSWNHGSGSHCPQSTKHNFPLDCTYYKINKIHLKNKG